MYTNNNNTQKSTAENDEKNIKKINEKSNKKSQLIASLNEDLKIIERSISEQKQNLSINMTTMRNIESLYINPLIEKERNCKILTDPTIQNVYLNKVIKLINANKSDSSSINVNISRSNSTTTEKRSIKLKREWMNSIKLNNEKEKNAISNTSSTTDKGIKPSCSVDPKLSMKLENKLNKNDTTTSSITTPSLCDIIGNIDINTCTKCDGYIISNMIKRQLNEWKEIKSQYLSQQKQINENINKLSKIKYKIEQEISKHKNN